MFQTTEFKKLQRQWYKKLEKTGFQNIEDTQGRLTDHQSLYDLNQRVHFKDGIKEITEFYYSWAGQMVYHGKFKCRRDKMIWKYHADGLTGAEISKRMGLERTWINRIIQKVKSYLK